MFQCILFNAVTHRGRVSDKRLSSAPTFITKSYDVTPGSPEKNEGTTLDRSPLDRLLPLDCQGGPTLPPKPQLQEISRKNPRYFSTESFSSDVVVLTAPPVDPTPTSSTAVSNPFEPAPQSDQEFTEPSSEGESHPPAFFNATLFSTEKSRHSNGSGLLSIITLPSFITNDRPRTHSSSTAVKLESPVRPHSPYRKQSSNLSQRFSGTDSGTTASPVSDGDASSKRNRPTSTTLQILTSTLKRNSSTSSFLRSPSPSSRRSSRRSLGRRNPSLGAEDEAVIQWRKLPPIPLVQGTPPLQNSPNQRAGEVKDSPIERLPSYTSRDSRPRFFLASQIPLPPSPSTLNSSVSSLAYAPPPSPQEISPINDFTALYLSHFPLPPSVPSTPGSFVFPPLPPSIPSTPRQFNFPPLPPSIPSTPGTFCYPSLPPSIPSTPGQFSYPPLPPSVPLTPSSTDKFPGVHMGHATDRLVSLAIGSLRRLSREVCRPQSDFDALSTATVSAFPGKINGHNGDGNEFSIYQRESSVYSETSGAQGLVLSPKPSFSSPSSPPPTMSPRGPRPRPLPMTPTQLNRSRTWHPKTSSASH